MQVTSEVSSRIKILRFPLIVGIVFIHAQLQNVGEVTKFTQTLIYYSVAQLAVPLFFIISGFLFFRDFELSFESYCKKIKARIHTLLVPYIFWNLSFLLLLLFLQSIPGIASFFNSGDYQKLILDYNFYDFMNAFIGLTGMPLLYQFWFIRDLMIMVLLSPIFFILAKKVPYLGLLMFAVLWILRLEDYREVTALLFFYLGGLIIVRDWNLTWIDKHKTLIIATYLTIILTSIGLKTLDVELFAYPLDRITLLIGIIIGIITIWCASDLVGKKAQDILSRLSLFSFFVYATHEPTLRIIRKLLYRVLPPSSSIAELVSYLSVPLVIIAITLAVGMVINRCTPKVFQVITGGRSA